MLMSLCFLIVGGLYWVTALQKTGGEVKVYTRRRLNARPLPLADLVGPHSCVPTSASPPPPPALRLSAVLYEPPPAHLPRV